MTTPGNQVEYALPPGHYAYNTLSPLVNHPDLAGDTIRDMDVSLTLRAVVQLGRAALHDGNAVEYAKWENHTEGFIDKLHMRPGMEYDPAQYYDKLANLRFYGASYGNETAAVKLHGMLKSDASGTRLSEVMQLCATYGVAPNAWIDHAPDADGKAKAWSRYTFTRRQQAEARGVELTPGELSHPGVEQYVQDFIEGNLSDVTTIALAANVYRLVDGKFGKRVIVSRFGLALSSLASSEEGISRYSLASVLAFATQANVDAGLSFESKEDIIHQIEPEIEGQDSPSLYEDIAAFRVSETIARNNVDIPTVLKMVEKTAKQYDHPYNQDRLHDTLLRRTAEMYASNGNFNRAAAVMAHIVNTIPWQGAIEHYTRLGGDVNAVSQADEMQNAFGAQRQNAAPNYPTVEWSARTDIANFLRQLSQAEYGDACQTLAGMANKIRREEPDAVNPQTYVDYTRMLLARDQESVSAATSLMTPARQPHFGYGSALYETFTAYGSTEAADANWKDIQTNKLGSRVWYLSRYAGATLAAAGIKE